MTFVVFDIGNVLLRWDPNVLTRRLIADPDRHAVFMATACNNEFLCAMDLASDSCRTAEERAREYPEFSQELQAFILRWQETVLGPITDNVALLAHLRAQARPVYAMSNFAADKFEQTRQIYPFLNDFDIAVISGRENTAKPDAKIYELLFERSGRKPEELTFIDDSPANVATARRLGMQAILYAPGVDLTAALNL